MSNILDFPKTFLDDEDATLLLDAKYKVYQPRDISDGVVYVEKYLIRKGKFVETKRIDAITGNLTASETHTNAFLVDETNFQDVGGGLQTFERHYATIPSSWYDFEEVSYRTVYWGAINYRTRTFGGATWHTQRNVLAKATRYYFTETQIPTNIVPESDTQATDYAFDFTKIYAQEPEGRLGRDWEDYTPDANNLKTVVIAPDKVQKYMGHIYEFIRYTIEV